MPSGSEPRGGGGGDLPVPFRFLTPGVFSSNVCVVCDEYGSTFEAMGRGGGGGKARGCTQATRVRRLSCLVLGLGCQSSGIRRSDGPGWLEIWMIACSLTCSSSIIDKLVYHT